MNEQKNSKPGPEPDRVNLNGDWEEAIKDALGKPRPEGGWPTDRSKAMNKGDRVSLTEPHAGRDKDSGESFGLAAGAEGEVLGVARTHIDPPQRILRIKFDTGEIADISQRSLSPIDH